MVKEKDNLEKYKVTVPKQFASYVKTQIMFFVIAAFIGSYMVLGLDNWLQKVACGVLIFCQFMILYASAYEIANHDIKSFSTLKPYNWKGFAFSGFVVGISIILFIVYKIVWMTGTLDNWGQVIGNILFLIWYLPYYCLVRPNCGAVNILGVVTAILVPVIASGIGYYAGKNQFDLSVVMKKYIYEKKK